MEMEQMDYNYAIQGVASLDHAIVRTLDYMPIQDEPYEEAFRNRDYQLLVQLGSKYDYVKLYGLKLDAIKNGCVMITKSDEKSDLIRNNGNKVLTHTPCPETDLQAMYAYDMALSYANTPERKAKACGNISVLYFRAKYLPQTLESIECAMTYVGSDEKLNEKLQARKLRCQEIMATRKAPTSCTAAKLGFPSHSTIAGLAGVLKFNGESVMTEKPLKCGDIVAITKSFSISHEHIFRRQFCNNCGDRTSGVKIPCDFCSTTLFCGEACKNQAMQGFHGIECESITDLMLSIDNDGFKYLAFKFAFKAMNIEKFAETSNFTCFDWKEGDEKDDGIVLKTILSMKEANLTYRQIFKLVTYFRTIMETLKPNQKFQDFITRVDGGENKLFDMFAKSYLVISQCGFFTDFTLNIDWLHGIIQHSCKPNVMIVRDSKLGTNNYIVIDDIAAGGKLTISYG